MIFENDNCISILRNELQKRIELNPLFSANSFARKLGISQAYLSLILCGRRSLNENIASTISDKLNFSKLEKEYFLLLSKKESASSDELKNFFQDKIQQLKSNNNINFIDLEKFHVIAEWYHSALLECLNLNNIEHSVEAYAKRLGIDIDLVKLAMARLEHLDLIKFDNQKNRFIRVDDGFITTPNEFRSTGLRKFHTQVLKMAIDAIENQPIEKRNISGITLALDPKKLPEAKERIQKFMHELMTFLEDGDRTEVYQLSTQLFKLEKQTEENENIKEILQ